MSVINVDNMNFDNSYSDLASAVDAAENNDEIRLFKDITINDRILFENKNLTINGNHHKVTFEQQPSSEIAYALALYSNDLKLIDLDVTIEGNNIFILQVENIKNRLVLDNVSIVHQNQAASSKMIPAIASAHDNRIEGKLYMNPLQTTELHNCNFDYVRIITNQLIIDSTSIDGTKYQSTLTGNQIDIKNSLINSAYISSMQTYNSVNLTNINSIGNLIVSGNMNLDGFKLLTPAKPLKDNLYALTVTAKRRGKFEHNFNQKSTNTISNLDFSAQQQQGVAAWFKVENADLTFNDTVVPETNGAPNEVENSSIHFNNTQNLSQWEQFNPNQQPDSDEDEPAPADENPDPKPDDQSADVDSDESVDPSDAITKLNHLVGLANVKSQVKSFVDVAKTSLRRQKHGLKASSISMNMLFEGNPGTGKTVVARLVGEAMFQNGILKGKQQDDGTYVSNFKEVQVQDLVDRSIGGTPMKTQEAVQAALDGVLFIDEAYSLAPVDKGSNGDIFKNEAVNTLIAEMENNRDRLVVIMAGYTKEMEAFMKEGNPGLSSRFTNKIIFPDYSPDELIQILKLDLKNNEYTCDSEALELIANRIREVYPYKGSTGNARFIRNVFDDLIKQQSMRLAPLDDAQLTTGDMQAITMGDVQNTIENSQHLQIDKTDTPADEDQQPTNDTPDKSTHNKPASASDPRNAIIQKSKVHSLQSLYKYHQIMDDLDADYDTRTDATLEILSLKNMFEDQLSSFNADDVTRAKLILPFFEAFDADIDYDDLNQQLEGLNGEQ